MCCASRTRSITSQIHSGLLASYTCKHTHRRAQCVYNSHEAFHYHLVARLVVLCDLMGQIILNLDYVRQNYVWL